MRAVQVYQATDAGRVRESNEDAMAVFGQDAFIVADGMGGHAAGEIASRTLTRAVERALSDVPLPWDEEALSGAILMANELILSFSREQPDLRGMGTTATVLHIHDGVAYWAHVGDSRIYLLRGTLRQLTRDHSYVEGLVEQGLITEEEARSHPKKNVLTRAVGVMQDIRVDTGRLALEAGDRFLVCTDGLTKMVGDDAIGCMLGGSGNLAAALVDAALSAGGTDNVTAIAVVTDDEGR